MADNVAGMQIVGFI